MPSLTSFSCSKVLVEGGETQILSIRYFSADVCFRRECWSSTESTELPATRCVLSVDSSTTLSPRSHPAGPGHTRAGSHDNWRTRAHTAPVLSPTRTFGINRLSYIRDIFRFSLRQTVIYIHSKYFGHTVTCHPQWCLGLRATTSQLDRNIWNYVEDSFNVA